MSDFDPERIAKLVAERMRAEKEMAENLDDLMKEMHGEGDLHVQSAGSDVDSTVPDLAGTVSGWRAWRVSDLLAGKPLLESMNGTLWHPRKPMVAECSKRGWTRAAHPGARWTPPRKPGDHEVPVEACTCGIYSAKNLTHLVTMPYHRYDLEHGGIVVVGEVALWGKVIEATQGWRAEKAYPRKLYVPYEGWEYAQGLGETYGVPVELKNTLDRKKITKEAM